MLPDPSIPHRNLTRTALGHLAGVGLSILFFEGTLALLSALVVALALALALSLRPLWSPVPPGGTGSAEEALCRAARGVLVCGLAGTVVAVGLHTSLEQLVLWEMSTAVLAAGAFGTAAWTGARSEALP